MPRWSIEKATGWTGGSGKWYTLVKNKTSRRTETRGPTNSHTSMITYCPPQRHLVDSHSNEGSSGCRNVNNNDVYKGCNLMNLSTYGTAGHCWKTGTVEPPLNIQMVGITHPMHQKQWKDQVAANVTPQLQRHLYHNHLAMTAGQHNNWLSRAQHMARVAVQHQWHQPMSKVKGKDKGCQFV